MRRLGRAGHGAGGDEVGEQHGVTERRREVDEERLARKLAGERGGRVDGQRGRAGATLGREHGHDRRAGAGGGLGGDRRRRRELLLPELVERERDLLDRRADAVLLTLVRDGMLEGLGAAVEKVALTLDKLWEQELSSVSATFSTAAP